MKIFITGDRGFIGTATIKALEKMRRPINLPNGMTYSGIGMDGVHEHKIVGYDIMDGYDIRDLYQLYETMPKDTDVVLHLAAIARFDEADADPRLCFETNAIGTRNVVEVCKEYKIPLVHASTGSCYMPIKNEPPITEDFPISGNSAYACSKSIAEQYVREHSPHIMLRYAHIYGMEKRNEGLIGNFMRRIEHDLEPELYGGKQSSDFIYIKDVVTANILAITAPWHKWNNAYNIGTGEEVSAKEAGQCICDAMKYKGKMQIKEGRAVDARRFVYDMTKSNEKLGFTPKYSFKEGVTDMFKDYNAIH